MEKKYPALWTLATPVHSWQTCANDLGPYFVTAVLSDGRLEDLEGGGSGLVERSSLTTREASVIGAGRDSNFSEIQTWSSYKAILYHSVLYLVCGEER